MGKRMIVWTTVENKDIREEKENQQMFTFEKQKPVNIFLVFLLHFLTIDY